MIKRRRRSRAPRPKKRAKARFIRRPKRDIFEHTASNREYDLDLEIKEASQLTKKPRTGKDIRLVEALKAKADLLQIEWAVMYSELSPYKFLIEVKGYSINNYNRIIAHSPVADWYEKKDQFRNKLSETIAKRQVDKLAEMNDEHIKAGRLGLAKGLQLLARGTTVSKLNVKSGKILKFERELYPQEYNFVMSGLKTAQQMYRIAMGLPSDGEGMADVLERLQKMQRPIQQNIQMNIGTEKKDEHTPESELKKLVDNLSYDEIQTFCDYKREKLKERTNG